MLLPYLVLLVTLSACGETPAGKVATPGDRAVLEQLADAYRAVADEYPVQPSGMRPEGRRQFVQQVFQKAGYDHRATLLALAAAGTGKATQEHRDLAELLLMPYRGLAGDELEKLASGDELAAVRTLRRATQ